MGGLAQPQEAEKDFAATVRFCSKATDFLDHTVSLSWSQRKLLLRREINRNAMEYVQRAVEVEAEAERAIVAHGGDKCLGDADKVESLASGTMLWAALSGILLRQPNTSSRSRRPSSSREEWMMRHPSSKLDKSDTIKVSDYTSSVCKDRRDPPTDLYFAVAVMAFVVSFAAYAQWCG